MIPLNVDPPADVAAILAGVQRVVAVRGSDHQPGCASTVPFPIASCCQFPGPPADLVAATEACEACGGQEVVTLDAAGWHDFCRSCEGHGKPLVELVTTCERCGGRPLLLGGTMVRPHLVGCPDCTNGQASRGRVVIGEVLAVVQWGEHNARPAEPHVLLEEEPGNGWFLMHHRGLPLTDQLAFLPPVDTLTEGGWYLATLDKIAEI